MDQRYRSEIRGGSYLSELIICMHKMLLLDLNGRLFDSFRMWRDGNLYNVENNLLRLIFMKFFDVAVFFAKQYILVKNLTFRTK